MIIAKKNTTKFRSNLQEKKVAKELGGRQVIGSGSLWGMSGDVRHEDILVECKTTKEDYYSLTIETWLKIRNEAIKDGLRIPVMCIDLKHGKTRIAVFEDRAFNDHRDYYRYTPEETWWSISWSLRIKAEYFFRCIFKQSNDLTLVLMPWENFLKILKSEVTK